MRVRATEVVPQGQNIYAFCNVRTNQVLYSFSRTLDNSALNQLPDIGANLKPPVLRKDLWRPLFSVTLPPGEDGVKQGLHAFRKLREWRKLHETRWEPLSAMSRNYTEKEIEKLQKSLDNRGGSKKETVYDLIRRKKWKMRTKIVMDQKANSIADLAAVLIEQEALGVMTAEQKQKRAEEKRKDEVAEIQQLSQEAENGGIEKLENKLEILQKTLEEGAEGQRTKLRKQIYGTKRSLDKMKWSAEAVRHLASAVAAEPAEAASEFAAAGTSEAAPESGSTEPVASKSFNPEYLPSFPLRFDRLSRERVPKRGPIRQEYKRQNAPIFTTQGITIKWANILDAEYAKSWPDAVQHERMGFTTRSAPQIDAESVAEYRALQWRNRPENFEIEGELAERVRKIRAEMGLVPRTEQIGKGQRVRYDLVFEQRASVPASTEDLEAEDRTESATQDRAAYLQQVQDEILRNIREKGPGRRGKAMKKNTDAPLPAVDGVEPQLTV